MLPPRRRRDPRQLELKVLVLGFIVDLVNTVVVQCHKAPGEARRGERDGNQLRSHNPQTACHSHPCSLDQRFLRRQLFQFELFNLRFGQLTSLSNRAPSVTLRSAVKSANATPYGTIHKLGILSFSPSKHHLAQPCTISALQARHASPWSSLASARPIQQQ